MVAIQKIGKSFMGALGYNLKKMDHAEKRLRAELLDTNFASLDSRFIKQEVQLLRGLRPNLNRYVYHTSLNFPIDEMLLLKNEKLTAIAHDYLKANGFTNNQYMIFRHHDAGHPHLHLLVNRIRFDGTVVSDSNNYKKSEAIVRAIERRYNLITVEPGNPITQRAAKKDELEMALRTGEPSNKMLLQELLKALLDQKDLTIVSFIRAGEAKGIHFLFNQATTGRISGITYFYGDFKIRGQALGNRFKWSELIKSINYEQIRDREAVSQANSRTRAIYGEQSPTNKQQTGERGAGIDQYDQSRAGAIEFGPGKQGNDAATEGPAQPGRESSLETGQAMDLYDAGADDYSHHRFDDIGLSGIADDVDDEAVYGKNRRKRRTDDDMSR